MLLAKCENVVAHALIRALGSAIIQFYIGPMKKIACLLVFILSLSCGKEKQDQRIVSVDKFMQGQAEFFKFNGNILIQHMLFWLV